MTFKSMKALIFQTVPLLALCLSPVAPFCLEFLLVHCSCIRECSDSTVNIGTFLCYRYEEKLKERLARRRERLAQGLPPDDEDDEDLEDGEAQGEQVTDVKAILDDLDKRYE